MGRIQVIVKNEDLTVSHNSYQPWLNGLILDHWDTSNRERIISQRRDPYVSVPSSPSPCHNSPSSARDEGGENQRGPH